MTIPSNPDRCAFRDPAGRRCRLPRKPTHPDLCAHHARIYLDGAPEDPKTLLAEILGLEPDLRTAQGINRTLGKLLELLISRRLPARQVALAGYLCQLLLQTLTHFEREQQLAIEAERNKPFTFITHIPRPKYTDDPPNSAQTETPVIPSLPEKDTSHVHR